MSEETEPLLLNDNSNQLNNISNDNNISIDQDSKQEREQSKFTLTREEEEEKARLEWEEWFKWKGIYWF